jgi:LmbE family N-acetylglucosaminyl deacetylase
VSVVVSVMASSPSEPAAISTNLAVPSCALAVGAHPDDVEFGCGATLAKWAASGCRIHHLICTDGSKGSWDPRQNIADLVAVRQAEQREAARVLGGDGEVVFLNHTDGELDASLAGRAQMAYWIRRLQPEVVLGHDPWRRYRLHPDHRHAGFLLTDGIVAARDPHFFAEQDAAPHRPSALLLWEADEPNHVEDVTGFVDTKLAALLKHRSQFRSTMRIEDPEAIDEVDEFRGHVKERLAHSGGLAGLPTGEAFRLLKDL